MPLSRVWNLLAGCLLAVALLASPVRAQGGAAPDGVFEFDLPRQSLDAALQSVALATGYRLLYSTDLVAGLMAAPLKGVLPLEQVLAALLRGSNLDYEVTPAGTIFIRHQTETMSDPAKVSEATGKNSTINDSTGVDVDRARLNPFAEAIGEVYVTARRRVENAQALPLTISSFEWPQLDFGYSGISNVQEIGFLVPNVSIRGGGTTAGTSQGDFRIRGVPGVARYMDGIYLRSLRGALQSVVELERVEILRGPQGTLFGKDAIGGAIQYISRPPAREFGVRLNLTGGTDDRMDIVANVDMPVREKLYTKLMVAGLRTGGYVDSVTVDKEYGGSEERQVRGSLRWEPSKAFEVNASVHYMDSKDDGDPQVLFTVNPEMVDGVPNDPWLYNYVDGNLRDLGRPILNEELPGKWKTRSTQTWSSFENTSTMLTGSMRWRPIEALELKWLSGFRDYHGHHYGDTDTTEYHVFESWRPAEGVESSQEFQATYQASALQWLFGIYYAEADARVGNWRYQNVELSEPTILEALREAFPGRDIALSRNSQTRTRDISRAIFGEVGFEFAGGWMVTYGVRYSSDSVRQSMEQPCETTLVVGVFPRDPFCSAGIQFDESRRFTRTTPRATVTYQWTPSVMTYLSWSQGFDKGGINTTRDQRTPPQLPNDGLFAFGPQVLTSYEAGLRSELMDGRLRLNATAFYGEWDDIQVMEELIPGQPGRWTSNAGAARIKGMELDVTGRIGTAVELTAGIGLLDSRYTDLGSTRLLSLDTPFPFAPESSFNVGAAYSRVVSDLGSIEWRAGYTWQDSVWTNQDDESSIELPPLGLLTASVTLSAKTGSWGLSLTGTNLTDEYYRRSGFRLPVSKFDFGTVAPPRQYSLTLRVATH